MSLNSNDIDKKEIKVNYLLLEIYFRFFSNISNSIENTKEKSERTNSSVNRSCNSFLTLSSIYIFYTNSNLYNLCILFLL